MASDDAIWVPVLPSLKDFGKNLASGTKGAGAKVGEQVGKEIADGISKSEAAVTKASSAAEKAHNRVADAAGKVRVAQEQYNKALESGDPVKIARAEEQLESQRRRQTEATTAAEQADKNLTDAQGRLAQAHRDSEQAAREQARAVGESKLSAEQAEQASKDLETTQRVLEVGLIAVGAAAIATAGYLVSLGSDFDSMSRDIRVGTGASGDALAGLEESALSVMRTVPNAMGEVGATIADLNTRLGLTGENLETVSTQFLELENLTGVAPNINDLSGAMKGFGVDSEDISGTLDSLFQVSQATGLGVNELASGLTKGGATFREFGFGIEDSAALLGSLDKAGIQGDQVVQRLTRSLGEFAESGKDPQIALRDTVSEIDNFMAAGDRASAYDLAEGLFGTRGAASFIDAVQSGSFELDDLMGSIGATDDTILGLADETRTLGEEFDIIKNQALAELEPIARQAFEAMRVGGVWLRENVVPAMQDAAEWIGENKELLIALGIGLGSMLGTLALVRVGLAAFMAVQRVWNVLTLLSTVGMKGLNTAMKANIFGLIAGAIVGLVAGLMWFFTQTETGKAIWESFTSAMGTAWEWVKGVLLSGWEMIKGAFAAAWAFISPIFDLLKVGLSAVGDAFVWVWNSIIKPTWDALGAGIAWVWNAIVNPVWEALKFALGLVGGAFQFYWNSVIKPAWDALGAGISWVWQNVISPAWDALKAALGAVGDFFNWVWHGVIKPAWDALGAGIAWVVDNVVHPVFEGLKTGLGHIETAFAKAVDFIRITWDKIKAITAAPINFVIREVYMGGLRPAWEKVANLVGLDPLPEIKEIGGFAEGTSRVPGVRTRHDNVQMVSTDGRFTMGLRGGEGVAVPEVVDTIGERNWNALNEAGLHGGAPAVGKVLQRMNLGGPAVGGLVDLGGFNEGGVTNLAGALSEIQRSHAAFVGRFFPGLFNLTSASRSEPGSMHDFGSQSATDWQAKDGQFATQMPTPASKGLARAIATNFPNTTQLIHHPLDGWQNILNGGPFDYGPGTNAGHSNHVHWGTRSPLQFDGDDIVLADIPGGAGGGISMASLAKTAWDKAIGLIPGFPGKDSHGLFGGVPAGFLKKSATSLWDFVKDKFTSLFSGGSGSGAEQWRDLARVALQRHGYDPDPYIDAMVKQIEIESGGDPNAINLWDSNAAKGTPSAGLLQVIEPTYRDVRNMFPEAFEGLPDNRTEPLTNLVAGIGALRRDWGGPAGGRWPTTAGYDQGGVLKEGITMAVNASGKPEAILTNQQWRDVSALVHELQFLTPEMKRWVDEGLVELERFANAAEKGFTAWASASTEQGRMGSPEEFARQFGQDFFESTGNDLLGMFGFGGLVGGQFSESFTTLLDELGAVVPILSAPDLLDDSGRVIGTKLEAPSSPSVAGVQAPELPQVDATAGAARQVTVVMDRSKSSYTAEEVEAMFGEINGRVDDLEIRVEDGQNGPAPLGAGVSGIV